MSSKYQVHCDSKWQAAEGKAGFLSMRLLSQFPENHLECLVEMQVPRPQTIQTGSYGGQARSVYY